MGTGCSAARPQSDVKADGVICFGHPLLDMMATVDRPFLDTYSVEPGSVNLAQPSQTPLFQRLLDDYGTNVVYVPGGAAMNTARTLAWLQPEMSVAYVGALGDDNFARILKSSLAVGGIRQHFEVHANKPTGTCAALVLDKERALLANLGAAVNLSDDFMESAAVRSSVESARLYYAEGFFMNTATGGSGLLRVARHAKDTGKLFTFNLNAPYLCATFTQQINELLPYIDILFGNEDDFLAYASVRWPADFVDPKAKVPPVDGSSGEEKTPVRGEGETFSNASAKGVGTVQETEDNRVSVAAAISTNEGECLHARLHRAATLIAQVPGPSNGRLVVITCGASSTILCRGGEVREVPVPLMDSVEMVDFNGAGDAFVGGFLAQYMLTGNEIDSATVGHATAQNCIRHNGAVVEGRTPSLERRRSVERRSPNAAKPMMVK